MRVVANRQLYGDYGMVEAGQEFECPDKTAHELLGAGLVREPVPLLHGPVQIATKEQLADGQKRLRFLKR